MEKSINEPYVITKEKQMEITPSMAVSMLKDGNKRFLEKKSLQRDLHKQIQMTATGQYPFAAVLSCIDSRVPAEILFDQGIGDIFNTRIAGNFVNNDILGSLEFACKVAGSKAILVLGHSSCGAVKGACDNVVLGNLTEMLSKIKPAVDAITDIKGERNSKNSDFVQKVSDMNVRLTVSAIMERSNVLKEMFDNGEITIVGAMYNVENGNVEFMEK